MATYRDISGQKFGKLTATKRVGTQNTKAVWEFICDCGTNHIATGTSVTSGSTVSCGCHRSSQNKQAASRAYHTWYKMIKRCNDPNDKNYSHYGGRGITVSNEWMDFLTFLSDMGHQPNNLFIERIDNNKGYCKENCKWATMTEQANNRRGNRIISNAGLSMTLAMWSRHLNIRPDTLYRRLKRMPKERALVTCLRHNDH
jgi:hypothetical protein